MVSSGVGKLFAHWDTAELRHLPVASSRYDNAFLMAGCTRFRICTAPKQEGHVFYWIATRDREIKMALHDWKTSVYSF